MKEIVIPRSRYEQVPVNKAPAKGNNQSMSKIGMLDMVGGNVVLRGRNGQRDMVYPLHKAWVKFLSMYQLYLKLMEFGSQSVYEMKAVLAEFAARLQQAVDYRKSNNIEIPGWINDKTIADLQVMKSTLA